MRCIHGLTLVFSIFIWRNVTGQLKSSPYQVSISFHKMGADGSLEHVNLCNGAIIHESFILTTADCLHVWTHSKHASEAEVPSTYQITAGTFGNDPSNIRYAEAIYVHDEYDFTTFQNDIALIRLNEPFQLKSHILQSNPPIQWIDLDKRNAAYENCFISPHNQTSKGYPYTAPQSTSVLENGFCNKKLNPPKSSERNDAICSYYPLNDRSMCKLQPAEYHHSTDRGTPLVCDSHLSGLLSQIIPPQTSDPNNLCEKTLKTVAFYTNVTNYVAWILHIITNPQTPSYSVKGPSLTYSQQPTSTTTTSESKTNGVERITKSLRAIMLFFSINLILTQIQF